MSVLRLGATTEAGAADMAPSASPPFRRHAPTAAANGKLPVGFFRLAFGAVARKNREARPFPAESL